MDPISSLYILLGLIGSVVFYTYWLEFINRSNTYPRNWIMLYIMNIFLHMIKAILIDDKILDLNLFPIFAYANINFTIFFVFATIFLSDRNLSVQIVFLILISIVTQPLFFDKLVDIDSFGTARIFFSLGSMLVVGIVFLYKSFVTNLTISINSSEDKSQRLKAEIDSPFNVSKLSSASIFLFSYGYLPLVFLQMGLADNNNNYEIGWMENIRSLSVIFIMSLSSAFFAWIVGCFQGKSRSDELDWTIITGANTGLVVGCSLPMQAPIWYLILFSILIGMIVALIYSIVFRKLGNPLLSFQVISLLLGGMIGFMSLPLINNPDQSSYELLIFVMDRVYVSILIIFVSAILTWIGIGLGILIDKFQFGIDHKNS
ncbi:hypothetical protein [Leptospira sp. GIMC2001]|uniref:hypothetical protein n=1 Tax=Leptospira sp. GIMC2001 TaxID=1513297 RepID=UPI002349753E|nr:hypothetical protein [Leptospira sp. GIMC2001]WCL50488.1 hypothetical protein O4O04_06615 [Leptospira sp. GIMC2001]